MRESSRLDGACRPLTYGEKNNAGKRLRKGKTEHVREVISGKKVPSANLKKQWGIGKCNQISKENVAPTEEEEILTLERKAKQHTLVR